MRNENDSLMFVVMMVVGLESREGSLEDGQYW